MPNYSNSVIYKIVCNNKSIHDIYVGSTCSFISRKAQHKSACNNANGKVYNLKVYKCIRGLGGWSNWSMIPIMQFPCESKMALQIKEREVMENHNATLNCNSAYNTEEETIEKKKISKKQWDHSNPDYMKKYAKDNAEHMKQLKKAWVAANRDKINMQVICECGSKVSRNGISKHRRTTKHFTLMESVVNQI